MHRKTAAKNYRTKHNAKKKYALDSTGANEMPAVLS